MIAKITIAIIMYILYENSSDFGLGATVSIFPVPFL